jgi:hypothetical protein
VGKASSAKRSRASAARLNPSRKRRSLPLPWIVVSALVVAAGILVIVLSRGSDEIRPLTSDHWHAAIGLNVCGQWASNPSSFDQGDQKNVRFDNPSLYAGIHTHDDGLIHVEAQSSVDTGTNATVGRFFQLGGWKLDGKGFDVGRGYPWAVPSGMKAAYHDGDKCPNGKPGRLVWSVRHIGDNKTLSMSGNPARYKLRDLDTIAIGFLTEGQELGTPPSGKELAAPTAEGGQPPASAAPSTVPAESTAPPETTAAANTTAP